MWETRSLDDCWDELTNSPASFVIVELANDLAPLLHRLASLPRTFPAARAAVVGERSFASYEWLLREAGAVHYLSSPRQVGPLAKMACRHLAQVPPPPQSLTERIWTTLPWG